MAGWPSDRMSDLSFRLMIVAFAVVDFVYPHLDRRVQSFGVRQGMTLVDYGCGPGRYTVRFARLVGPSGRVVAVDVHELAIESVRRKTARLGLSNVEAVLTRGYASGLPDHIADMVCAMDMFFSVGDPTAFLGELRRIAKPGAMLILDDGHQSRAVTRQKLLAAGSWDIVEETRDHLTCRTKGDGRGHG